MKKYIQNEKGEGVIEYVLVLSVVAIIMAFMYPLIQSLMGGFVTKMNENAVTAEQSAVNVAEKTEEKVKEKTVEAPIPTEPVESAETVSVASKEGGSFMDILLPIVLVFIGLSVLCGLIVAFVKVWRTDEGGREPKEKTSGFDFTSDGE